MCHVEDPSGERLSTSSNKGLNQLGKRLQTYITEIRKLSQGGKQKGFISAGLIVRSSETDV